MKNLRRVREPYASFFLLCDGTGVVHTAYCQRPMKQVRIQLSLNSQTNDIAMDDVSESSSVSADSSITDAGISSLLECRAR